MCCFVLFSRRRLFPPRASSASAAWVSCDIHAHTPAKKSSTNFLLYPSIIRKCSTNWLGHGDGYAWHSPVWTAAIRQAVGEAVEVPRKAARLAEKGAAGMSHTQLCLIYIYIYIYIFHVVLLPRGSLCRRVSAQDGGAEAPPAVFLARLARAEMCWPSNLWCYPPLPMAEGAGPKVWAGTPQEVTPISPPPLHIMICKQKRGLYM